jgi:hypothetical protein
MYTGEEISIQGFDGGKLNERDYLQDLDIDRGY